MKAGNVRGGGEEEEFFKRGGGGSGVAGEADQTRSFAVGAWERMGGELECVLVNPC